MATTLNEIDLTRGQTMTKYKDIRREFGTVSYQPLVQRPDLYDTQRHKKDPFDEYLKAQMKSSDTKVDTKPKNIKIDDKKSSTEKVIESISETDPETKPDTKPDTKEEKVDPDMLFLMGEDDKEEEVKEEEKAVEEVKEEDKDAKEEEAKEDSQTGGHGVQSSTSSFSPKTIVLKSAELLHPENKKKGGEFLI